VVGGRHDKEGESSVLLIHLFTRKSMSGIIFNFLSFFLSIFYCEGGGGWGRHDGNVGIISCIVGKVKMY